MLHPIRIDLRLNQAVTFPFLHGRIVYGLLANALGLSEDRHFPGWLLPLAPESGRTVYHPDSPYALGLVLLGRPESLWPLVHGLEEIGADHRLVGRQHLGGNFRVEGIVDLHDGHPLSDGQPPRPLELFHLSQAARTVAGQTRVRLRFVSPLRLPRHARSKTSGHAFCDDQLFEGARLLENLVQRVGRLAPDLPAEPPTEEFISQVRAHPEHLIWVDLPKHDAPQTTGGVLGQVTLEFPQTVGAAAPFLLLGQYLGLGKDITFGFGHYRILMETGLPPLARRAETLARAASRLAPPAEVPDQVEDDDEDFVEPMLEWEDDQEWAEALASLADGSRLPRPLAGRVLVKSSGKARALALPAPEDQALQRRVQALVAPAIDEILETSSHAYRRGLSREGAATALRRAYEQGLRWVLRADITAFFDSVDWSVLRGKLEALWDDDPLVELLLRWIQAPVRFGEQLIQRDRGLPQGAVLSPLLANLFLDQFDEDVQSAGFKLVRYADDFVICCSSRDEVETARQTVIAALTDLQLTLHDEKSTVTSFDEGFNFLGYVFCRSMIVQRKKKKEPTIWLQDLDEAVAGFWAEAVRSAPPGAWLAGLRPDSARPQSRSGVGMTAYVSRTARAHGRAPLYLAGPEIKVRTSLGRLFVTDTETQEEAEIPLALVEAVICLGPVFLSSPVIRACLRHHAPVYLCTATGDLAGQVQLPGDFTGATLIQAQVDFIRNQALTLALARDIVAAKISNCRTVLRRRTGRDQADDSALEELQALMAETDQKKTIEDLLGLEARAARIYFDRFQARLPAEFGFSARSQRPAEDPVNAMLNFGYSLLYRQTSGLLQIERLNPTLGIYHRPSDRYHPLAADMQEEFRHLVDLLVLRLIHQGQVTLGDFDRPEKHLYGCRIGPGARRTMVLLWQKRLEETIRPDPEGPEMTYRQLMHRQIWKLKAVIMNPTAVAYTAFRSR